MEQFSAEVQYHSAYNFLSLKGAIAERWAHGPAFGAYSELAQQAVSLTAGPDRDNDIQGLYGLKSSSFRRRNVTDYSATRDLAMRWLGDVFEVLDPQRSVAVVAHWFGLYPIANPARATQGLRQRYAVPQAVSAFKLDGHSQWLSGVDGMTINGNENLSYVIGAVGPPHRGRPFSWEDEDRDSKWWMGVNVTIEKFNESGLDDPLHDLEDLLARGAKYYSGICTRELPFIVG